MTNPIQTVTGSWNGGATTVAVTFSTLPTAGDSAIIVVNIYSPGATVVSSIADNQGVGNSYVSVAGVTEPALNQRIEMWWCKTLGATSGTFTATVTLSGSNNALARAIECSGLTAVDLATTATTGATATTLVATQSGANSNANDFVVAGVALQYTGSGNPLISTPTTGYTQLSYDSGFTGYVGSEVAYKNVSVIETDSATWTWTGSLNAGAIVASFKAGGGGGGGGGCPVAWLT